MSKIKITVLALFIVSLGFQGCSGNHAPPKPTAKDEVTIGAVLPLTGKAASYGERSLQGFQLALQAIAAQGHHPVLKLAVEDSQSQARQAVTAYTKLVDIDKVPAVLGLLTSDEALACAPIAERTKTVLLSPGATAVEFRDAGDFVFRNRESVDLQTEVIAKACVEHSGKDGLAVLHAQAANGLSYRDTFVKAIEALGGTIVGTVAYTEGKTDYRAEIEQLRALHPKSVYLAGYDTELGLILKQSKEVGFHTAFYASAGAVTPRLLDIAKDAAEGLEAASASFDPQSKDERIHGFVEAYKAKFGKEPDWLAANSYDAVMMIDRLTQQGARTGESLKTGLYGTQDYPGVSGTTSFDKDGEVRKPIGLVRVKERRFQSL